MIRIFFICSLFLSNLLHAQVTHSIGFNIGLSNVYYKSDVAETKSKIRGFLPTIQADYSKQNDNVFWGGFGIGFTLRQVPIYEFSQGDKSGLRMAELYARVRAGLKFENEFTTQMPFLSIGIAKHVDHEFYLSNGTSNFSYNNQMDSSFTPRPMWPFIEIGSKLINSSFRQDKRNVSFTFSFRYYPTPIFTEPFRYQYDYNEFVNIQYHLFEFCITAGLQRNIHK